MRLAPCQCSPPSDTPPCSLPQAAAAMKRNNEPTAPPWGALPFPGLRLRRPICPPMAWSNFGNSPLPLRICAAGGGSSWGENTQAFVVNHFPRLCQGWAGPPLLDARAGPTIYLPLIRRRGNDYPQVFGGKAAKIAGKKGRIYDSCGGNRTAHTKPSNSTAPTAPPVPPKRELAAAGFFGGRRQERRPTKKRPSFSMTLEARRRNCGPTGRAA